MTPIRTDQASRMGRAERRWLTDARDRLWRTRHAPVVEPSEPTEPTDGTTDTTPATSTEESPA
jgi:hypothetical protein